MADRAVAHETPIVFRSQFADGPSGLYVMAPDGSGLRRVTRDGDFSVPEWSPDGQSIAFRNNAAGVNAEVGIVMLDGSPPIMLTQGESSRLLNAAVHWLPDGQELAYASWPEVGSLQLWAISRFGGEPRRLLANVAGNQETVTWSPSGPSTIAYTEHGGDRNIDVWVAASDGTGAVNLTQGRVFAPRYPQWSPDGTRIALSGFAVAEDGTVEGLENHGSTGSIPDAEIFVIDSETQALTRVTDNEWDDQTPTWAPDGEHLLVASLRDGDTDLWLVPLDAPEQAQNLIEDADSPREDAMPHWYRGQP